MSARTCVTLAAGQALVVYTGRPEAVPGDLRCVAKPCTAAELDAALRGTL
jgi:hypothetical protein